MSIIHTFSTFLFLGFIFQIIGQGRKLEKKGVPVAAKGDRRKTGLVFLLSVFFTLFIFEMLDQSFAFSFSLLPAILSHSFHSSWIMESVGLILQLLSIWLMRSTLKAMKDSLRFGLYEENLGRLVTHGPFARTRNPFFISITLQLAGIALVFNTFFFYLILFLAVPGIHFFVLREERFMKKNYGEHYHQYCKSVRRYL